MCIMSCTHVEVFHVSSVLSSIPANRYYSMVAIDSNIYIYGGFGYNVHYTRDACGDIVYDHAMYACALSMWYTCVCVCISWVVS